MIYIKRQHTTLPAEKREERRTVSQNLKPLSTSALGFFTLSKLVSTNDNASAFAAFASSELAFSALMVSATS
jgi:hypothetical protein